MIGPRYGFDTTEMDGVAVLEAIAEKRNCRRKTRGGTLEMDLEKAAIILLTDYRGGVLGRISLETPETRATMVRRNEAAVEPAIEPDPDTN
jgi:ribosome biogenesis GTPase A